MDLARKRKLSQQVGNEFSQGGASIQNTPTMYMEMEKRLSDEASAKADNALKGAQTAKLQKEIDAPLVPAGPTAAEARMKTLESKMRDQDIDNLVRGVFAGDPNATEEDALRQWQSVNENVTPEEQSKIQMKFRQLAPKRTIQPATRKEEAGVVKNERSTLGKGQQVRLTESQINKNNRIPPPKDGGSGKLSPATGKLLAGYATNIEELENIKKQAAGPDMYTGPGAGIGNTAAAIVGMDDPKFSKMRADAANVVNQQINILSGANVPKAEMDRLKEGMPIVGQPNFQVKLDSTLEHLKRLQKNLKEVNGIITYVPDAGAPAPAGADPYAAPKRAYTDAEKEARYQDFLKKRNGGTP